VPSRTGRNIAVDTAVRLAEHDNIRGYKAASGDLNRISEVIERTREEDFAILSGDDGLTLPTLSVGGHGAISVVANVEPERTCAMVGAALEGDYAFARALHHELAPLVRQLFVETNPIPVKAAMEIRGHGSGRIRSPLTELSDDHREELAARLAELDGEPSTPEEAEVTN
jgi:4-hydroxy-tetrahydrodipicolinate synthase